MILRSTLGFGWKWPRLSYWMSGRGIRVRDMDVMVVLC